MLAQNHACRSHSSCQEQYEAEPPQGIEGEGYRIGHQRTCHTSDCRRMGADFPPYVDEGASHLYGECHYQDDADDAGRVAVFHPEEATEITQDGDDVRHDASLLPSHLMRSPTLYPAVEVDEQRWRYHRKQVDDEQQG